MSVLVLGAGAIGGYLGARMCAAGIDVTFLVRPERTSQIRRSGLSVSSSLGNWHGHPSVIGSDELSETFEIVIIACKAFDLASALDAVGPAIGRESIILPFLNGVSHLGDIRRRYPGAAPWGGVAHIGVTTDAPGKIRHLNDLNNFWLGSIDGQPVPGGIRAIVERLGDSPVRAEIRPNIRQDMWDKLVFLATLAGMTCLMRADVGSIIAAPDGEQLLLQLLSECSLIAESEGFAPKAEAMAGYRSQLTERGSKSTASMLRDIRAGRTTEVDHILGDLARRAERNGLDTPLLRICLTHLQTYEFSRETSL